MMNKSQILRKIGNIIEELGEQQQYLASTSKINLLELELFTANADFLIDHIEILKKLNEKSFYEAAQNQPLVTEDLEPEPKIEPRAVAQDIPTEEESKSKFRFSFDEEPTEMVFDFEKKIAVNEVFDRPLSEEEQKLIAEKTSAPEASKEEFIVLDDVGAETNDEETKIARPEILLDKEPELQEKELSGEPEATEKPVVENVSVTEEQPVAAEAQTSPILKSVPATPPAIETPIQPRSPGPEHVPVQHVPAQNTPVSGYASKEERPLTLNEMLSAKLNQAAGHQNNRHGAKLEDLKSAISINDKMVFIKELFNGYNLAYSEAIEIVNRFESFDAADNFLQKNYAVKNDWESKQPTVERFYEYLRKKFVA